jgi:endoglucanase
MVALVDHGQSVYSFVFKHSGKCLEVENASTTNGARLVQRTCTSAQNQKLAMWFSASQTGRYFKFLHSEMCIQVQNANTGNSAPVVQATCPEGDDPLSAKFVE